MVKYFSLITVKASVLLAFIFQFTYAQQEFQRNDFEEFTGFKKLGYHVSGVSYLKAQINRKYGNYTLNNFAVLSGRIGVDYVFNHQKDWTLRTGIYLDLIPFYNVDYAFKQEDIPPIYNYVVDNKTKNNSKLVFTIPVLAESKLQFTDKLFFVANMGLEFTLLSSGSFSLGHWVIDEEQVETEIFALYGNTADFWIYPSVRLSPGFYWLTDKVIYQLSFTYKKNIVPYFKGEYQFGNLAVSEPTRGDYKVTGDYIGLGITLFFKKKNR